MFKDTENFKDVDGKQAIEILMATMDRENLDFVKPIFPQGLPENTSLLIVNQSKDKTLTSKEPQIRVVNSTEKGLSKSRNLALKHATGDICVFADDDILLMDGFEKKVQRAFAHFQNSSFIRFRTEKESGQLAKKYPETPKKQLSWMDILSTSSLEMAIKRKDILSRNICFDDRFGLGGTFKMGEEQLFLAAIKKNRLQLSYFPETLIRHENPSSMDKIGFRERYFIQGALTTAIFNEKAKFWLGLKIGFDLKHNKLSTTDVPTALHEAKKGKKHYLKLKK